MKAGEKGQNGRYKVDPEFMIKDPSGKLSIKDKLFCHYYILNGFNGAQAARDAGWSENNGPQQACVNMDKPDILAYIKILKDDLGRTLGITRQRVARELAKLAFYDARNLFNPDGTTKNIQDLDDETAAAINGLDIYEEKDFIDGSPIGTTKKVKLADRRAALMDLNKMLGYNEPDKQELMGKDGKPLMAGAVMLKLPEGMDINLPTNLDGDE